MNLSAVDMNLVPALHALLSEQSVTRAARRVGLSQPAMSHALTRLREHLGDPLLVRVGREMHLTERAAALRPHVDDVVRGLEGLFSTPHRFDPAASARVFRVAATDYAQLVVLPHLTTLLAREAPQISLHVVPSGERALGELLRAGDADLGVGLLPPGAPDAGLYQAELFTDRFVGLCRRGHPRVRGRVDLATYASLTHVLVSPRGSAAGVVDELLAERGLSRRLAVVVPHFLVAPHIVAATDHVATLAQRVAAPFCKPLSLSTFEPPLSLEPTRISMLWHARAHEDPAHRWLRRAVVKSSPRAHAGAARG